MTDPPRIRALIAEIEAGHVGREESDEYLVLCCGWWFGADPKSGRPWATTADGDRLTGRALKARPHPLDNAQDALDSLPEGTMYALHGTVGGHCMVNLKSHGWSWDAPLHRDLAAAICLARLNMELAKESGDG